MSNMAKILLSAKLENLESMIEFIRDGAEKYGFDNKKIDQIHLASEEALVNIINYAYPDKNGSIEITYDIKEGKGLVIEIIDWGIPFDPLSIPEPDIDAPIEDRTIGGLGIFFIKKVVDEVRYRRDGQSNILTITIN
jgi:serine/threonine-protein kinase RsbW